MGKDVEPVLSCGLRHVLRGIREHDEWSLSLTPRDGHDLRPLPRAALPSPLPFALFNSCQCGHKGRKIMLEPLTWG